MRICKLHDMRCCKQNGRMHTKAAAEATYGLSLTQTTLWMAMQLKGNVT